MTGDLARITIVAGVVAGSLGLAWWSRWRATRKGAPIDVTGLMVGPGAVVFTKDECATCAATLELVEAVGLSIRQVRAEDEPALLEQRGVTGVPATVIVGPTGRPCAQFSGLPPRRPLQRAARRAREIPGARPREL